MFCFGIYRAHEEQVLHYGPGFCTILWGRREKREMPIFLMEHKATHTQVLPPSFSKLTKQDIVTIRSNIAVCVDISLGYGFHEKHFSFLIHRGSNPPPTHQCPHGLQMSVSIWRNPASGAAAVAHRHARIESWPSSSHSSLPFPHRWPLASSCSAPSRRWS